MSNERDDVEILDLKYPSPRTSSAKIVECLEAEPAGATEISVYLGIPEKNTRGLLQKLKDKGLIKHDGEGKYELIDPVGASLAYSEEEIKT